MTVPIETFNDQNTILINPAYILRVEVFNRRSDPSFKVRLFYSVPNAKEKSGTAHQQLQNGLFIEEFAGNSARMFIEQYQDILLRNQFLEKYDSPSDKQIDVSLVEEFLDNTSLDLSDRNSITVMAARLLANCKRSELHLDGISRISASQLQALAEFRGDLYLNGLTELPSFEHNMISWKVRNLYLNGLQSCPSCSWIGGENRSWGERTELHLDGISRISASQLQALAEFPGVIHLNGLTELPSFNKHGGISWRVAKLHLNGLQSWSPDLLWIRSETLYLGGISAISENEIGEIEASEPFMNSARRNRYVHLGVEYSSVSSKVREYFNSKNSIEFVWGKMK